jgi:hypothetical protein
MSASRAPSSQYWRRTRPIVEVEAPVASTISLMLHPLSESSKICARTRSRGFAASPFRRFASCSFVRRPSRTAREVHVRACSISGGRSPRQIARNKNRSGLVCQGTSTKSSTALARTLAMKECCFCGHGVTKLLASKAWGGGGERVANQVETCDTKLESTDACTGSCSLDNARQCRQKPARARRRADEERLETIRRAHAGNELR